MAIFAPFTRPVNGQTTESPHGIIPPAPGEHVAYLLQIGDVAAALRRQAEQIAEGRAAALAGRPYIHAQTRAWQRGYVEALQDLEA